MNTEVLALLDRYKADHNIATDGELAALLGVSRVFLSYVRHGQRSIGGKTFRAIMAKCPDLRLDLAQIMAKGGDADSKRTKANAV